MFLLFLIRGVKARSYASLVVAAAGGLDVHNDASPDLAAMKPSLPFGQLPSYSCGDVNIAQSNAILRVIGRKAGTAGDSDADFAFSEMLIEEQADIYNLIVKANYSPNKAEAYNELFAAGGSL
jgi:hypothetical protein